MRQAWGSCSSAVFLTGGCLSVVEVPPPFFFDSFHAAISLVSTSPITSLIFLTCGNNTYTDGAAAPGGRVRYLGTATIED